METTTYDLLKNYYPFFISFPQAAEITGTHASTWGKWQALGQMPIPFVLMGGIRRVRLIDLCAYLDKLATTEKAIPKKSRGRPRKVNFHALHTPV